MSAAPTILNLTGDHDTARINSPIAEFNPSITAAGGGDGTVNLVARQILDRDIRLGIIPLGSSNGMAYQLNIPDQPVGALKNICSGNSRSIDLLLIIQKYICLNMSDLGMNARVIKHYEKEGIRSLYDTPGNISMNWTIPGSLDAPFMQTINS